MRDIIDDVDSWLDRDNPIAMATVVETWGSSPRHAGAKMAVTSSGQISGSVSGGCVEGAVAEACLGVINGEPPVLLKYGVSDATAWDVGLACGGTIEIFVDLVQLDQQRLTHDLVRAGKSFTIATVIGGPDQWVGDKVVVQKEGKPIAYCNASIEPVLESAARSILISGKSQRQLLLSGEQDPESIEVFVEVVEPAPTLLMVGGVHIAVVLARIAQEIRYHTIVVDPRKVFGSEERFAGADQLIQAWPKDAFEEIEITSSTAIALLTHDPKIDDPAAILALASPAFYIGALGSRKTHAARRERLTAAGITASQLDRIHAPIGIDIGASSPEEIAVSIMAEIVASRHAR
jgi:xanthine dehydrogenase accessory factor